MKIRALIVDDEPIARRGIRLMLEQEDDVDIIGECSNGQDAIDAIQEQRPDLVFLDVQMPDLNGFEVLEAVGMAAMPVVIFVTAYDRYAIQAFEVHALDYLLKPFDDERFQAALDRARLHIRRFKEGVFTQKLQTLLEALELLREPAPEKTDYLDRLAVKAGGRVQFFKVEEVDWIEAAGDYMCLHVGQKPHYVRETMSTLEAKLDPRRFVRIHRSTIVNVDRIRELRGQDSGGYVVRLYDGTELKLSRSYQSQVFSLFGDAA